MVAKKGRPTMDNSKKHMLRVRIDKETLNKLDECCDYEKKSRSEIVREGIEDKNSRIKK